MHTEVYRNIQMKENGIKKIRKRVEARRKKAIEMYREDFSYRQIQRALGYKSVRSVQELLKNEINLWTSP